MGNRWTDDSRNRSRLTRCLAASLVLLITLVSLELACRAYWSFWKGVPFLGTQDLWVAFYPEIPRSGILEADFSAPEKTFDVVLLGGSVLTKEFGPIATRLRERLVTALDVPTRVFNLSEAARTSRDSYLKYLRVQDKPCDLLVVYDSINDLRMNNCAPGDFRADYSHCAWYRQLYLLSEHSELRVTVLPYTLRYLGVEVMLKTGLGFFIPRHQPDERWVHGGGFATDKTLRSNLEAMLDSARDRGQLVALCSFAAYVPPNYSLAAFQRKSLDYARHRSPIEIWGNPKVVAEGLATHNRVIGELSAEYDDVAYVDQARLIRVGRDYFDDICHLTDLGCECFVNNLVAAVMESGHPRVRALLAARRDHPTR